VGTTIPFITQDNFELEQVAYFSDKCNLRGPFIIGGSIASLLGFIILITQVRSGVGYVGTIIAVTGLFPIVVVDLAWVSSVAGGDVRKGASSFIHSCLRCRA